MCILNGRVLYRISFLIKNLALAQFGNLPDGLFNAGMSDYDLLRYAKQGIIIPLENLIDKYMPNLQAVFEKYPEYRTMCTAPDGHIYSFPWIEQLGAGKEAIQAIGDIAYINKKWLDYLGLEIPTTTDELEQVLIAFRDHADELQEEFDIEGDVIPMSFIINNGDQDPAILINGFGEGYGDTGDHFAVTDEGKVIYTAVQEGYKEGIEWLHKLVTEDLIDPEAFTQEWSTYVAKGKNHRYGLCFSWDIANIDNNVDYVMLPALTGPTGVRNITRQNNSETSGLTEDVVYLRPVAEIPHWQQHGSIRCMHHYSLHRITGAAMVRKIPLTSLNYLQMKKVIRC